MVPQIDSAAHGCFDCQPKKQGWESGSGLHEGSTRVGSTSLLRGQSSALTASVRTLDGLAQAHGADHPTVLHLQDLKKFVQSLEAPLKAARSALGPTDADLQEAVHRTCLDAQALCESGGEVLLKWVMHAQEMGEGLFPNLKFAMARGKRHSFASLLGSAQSHLADMWKLAEDTRRKYVRLLNNVLYLIQCVQLSLDFLAMQDAHEQVACLDEDSLWDVEWTEDADSSSAQCLQHAMLELESAAEVLENCSGFWLFLHATERGLHKLEGEAQELRSQSLPGSKVAAMAPQAVQFVKALEQVCQQYFAVLEDGQAQVVAL